MKRALTGIAISLLIALGLATIGCATGPQSPVADDTYSGYGEGETLGQAMNAAKMDAVRKSVIDLIGAASESRHRQTLDEVLYGTANPNAYVHMETLETTRKEGSLLEGEMVFELTIQVNLPAVRSTLERAGITGGPADSVDDAGTPSEVATEGDPESSSGGVAAPVDLAPADGDWEAVTADEERFIRRFVETMTYMVYFKEDASVVSGDRASENAEFIMQSAVNQANSYLVADGRVVVDAAQIERLKSDQELVYEEETGREITLLQWVARRLNADVYIEFDARVTGTTTGGNHYGTADVTLNMYDTSTAQILGSINRRSQNSFSRTSEQDAMLNAVQSTVYQGMPDAVEMARDQMARMATRGIRYEVTIQNPPDPRSLSRFRSAVSDVVREIATVSQSPEEVVYELFAIGSTDDIVDLIYEVSDRVAGFEDIVVVISRGRAVTFDAGF